MIQDNTTHRLTAPGFMSQLVCLTSCVLTQRAVLAALHKNWWFDSIAHKSKQSSSKRDNKESRYMALAQKTEMTLIEKMAGSTVSTPLPSLSLSSEEKKDASSTSASSSPPSPGPEKTTVAPIEHNERLKADTQDIEAKMRGLRGCTLSDPGDGVLRLMERLSGFLSESGFGPLGIMSVTVLSSSSVLQLDQKALSQMAELATKLYQNCLSISKLYNAFVLPILLQNETYLTPEVSRCKMQIEFAFQAINLALSELRKREPFSSSLGHEDCCITEVCAADNEFRVVAPVF